MGYNPRFRPLMAPSPNAKARNTVATGRVSLDFVAETHQTIRACGQFS